MFKDGGLCCEVMVHFHFLFLTRLFSFSNLFVGLSTSVSFSKCAKKISLAVSFNYSISFVARRFANGSNGSMFSTLLSLLHSAIQTLQTLRKSEYIHLSNLPRYRFAHIVVQTFQTSKPPVEFLLGIQRVSISCCTSQFKMFQTFNLHLRLPVQIAAGMPVRAMSKL